MDGEFKRTIGDYFLFTIVGALILPEVTAIFSIGDGIIGINERLIEIGPFPNNQPPYSAYSLLDQSLTGFSPDELRFTVHSVTPTNEVQTVLIGTDGVMDLSRAFPLNQFWENDLYFKNPDAVRRRLALINKESIKIDWEKKVKELPNWQDYYHLIILPTYKEKPKIIKESLDSLINSNYPKEKLIVVLAIEERAGIKAKEIANLIFPSLTLFLIISAPSPVFFA